MSEREGHFSGAEGHSIYYRYWLPEQPPQAVLLVVHGAAEHSGRYARFAEHFVARGFACAALDHIGHGQSEGTPGYIRDFDDHVETLDRFQRQVSADFGGVPLILLGHSMGGLISCCYLLQHQDAFAGCILSGPAIKTELEPPWWQRTLIQLFSRLLPKLGVLQLDAAGVSRDPAEVKAYREDALVYTGKLSARMVSQLFAAMQLVQHRAAEIHCPLLLLHGGADVLTAPSGSQFLNDSVASADKTLKIYPGLYHEIFNEPERADVFADIETWLAARLADRQSVASAQVIPEREEGEG